MRLKFQIIKTRNKTALSPNKIIIAINVNGLNFANQKTVSQIE